jgi:probable rRNA maturation factor
MKVIALAEIDVLIEGGDWPPESEAIVLRAANAALAALGEAGARVSVLLTDDASVQKLNAQFRAKDKPTNVLSFPSPEIPGDPAPLLGDLALAGETCAREALEESKSLHDHLSHLVVHGVLHLCGYDHETSEEAEEMEALEREILATLTIADPYADTDPIPVFSGGAA